MHTQLREHPLGHTVPDSIHAVCCSLPTLADVIGYEERQQHIMEALKSGYPRFVTHPYVARAIQHIADADASLTGRKVYLVPSQAAVERLLAWLGGAETLVQPVADFFAVALHSGSATLPTSDPLLQRAKAFLQHTGLQISSRQAEAYLVAKAVLEAPQDEVRYLGASSEAYVKAHLKDYIPTRDLYLTNSGMNAFYAALLATRQVQAPLGKRLYVQLGWLYLDTQCILGKFLESEESLHIQFDVFDKVALEKLFAERGHEIAALVTELPTNPLIQTPDVDWLSELCLRHGVARIFDPTVAGVANVDVLPHCDLLMTSLTKYAASRGDVMLGALAINPQSPLRDQLAAVVGGYIEPPYEGDCARLAAQIADMPTVAKAQNANALALVQWLSSHPAVKRVHHSKSGPSAEHYARIAREESAVGAMFTIELNGDLAAFFDNTPLVKGPSFGTDQHHVSISYMAHYEEVTCKNGRARLFSLGLDPELVRISVGVEPLLAIEEALTNGLSKLGR